MSFTSTSRTVVLDDAVASVGGVENAAAVFEPVVNVPALAAFALVVVVFGTLQLRITAVAAAAERRVSALETLRRVKAAELGGGDGAPDAEVVAAAVDAFASALREEEDLRTVAPGVRVAAPNAAERDDEIVDAARRFLGVDLRAADADENDDENETRDGSPSLSANPSRGWSTGALAVIAAVVASQIVLLYVLSFDPLASKDAFDSLSMSSSSSSSLFLVP